MKQRNLNFLFGLGLFAALLIIIIIFFMKESNILSIISDSGSHDLMVEIVRTPEDKAEGLMFRENLGENRGMLFVYETPANPRMWMKNMRIPLDMIFIGPDLQVTHVQKEVPPCLEAVSDDCPVYTDDQSVSYVLEVPAGYAETKGIQSGDSIVLPALLVEGS
jgi:uncharacterized membrane protein (UPF0127 family)